MESWPFLQATDRAVLSESCTVLKLTLRVGLFLRISFTSSPCHSQLPCKASPPLPYVCHEEEKEEEEEEEEENTLVCSFFLVCPFFQKRQS